LSSGRGKGEERELLQEDELESEDEDAHDENMVSLEEFVEFLKENQTNHVGRALLLSLMHIKQDKTKARSKNRLYFHITDIFNLFSSLPNLIKQEIPVLHTVGDLLQGKVAVDLDKVKIRLNLPFLPKLQEVKSNCQDRCDQIVEVNKIMKKYREDLESQRTADATGQTCVVSIADLMWMMSMISNQEDKKHLIMHVIMDSLNQLEHLKITPSHPSGKFNEKVGDETKRRYAEELPRTSMAHQEGVKRIRRLKLGGQRINKVPKTITHKR
jgi:hypothetical protein